MRIVETFPRRVREIENLFIPLPDGCRLAARMWLPDDALESPVPAIIEYIPYRKRDGTRHRDEPMHRYFAGHGYAALRIDLRGSGDSDGVLLDEYLPREQEDGVHAIRWIAEQPWCSGAVGMMGKSWGGFNALQVAAMRPPELAAIITVCSTDDRYADDAHYMGGCLLLENLTWGSVLFTLNALPPDPEVVGGRWRSMWLERLEAAPLYAETWMRHPRRDAYWKQGSVCEDYSRIACPVYAVGGWADGYTNAVPRLLAGLEVPRKGLIGPWAHVYPHEGRPEPAIGFLQEALRWWDRWLKGRATGIVAEPALRVWMEEGVPPGSSPSERRGRWVAEEGWPSRRIARRRWHLAPGRLLAEGETPPAAPGPLLERCSPQTVGLAAGSWCSFGEEDLPEDQGGDDAGSLVFDSRPLDAPLPILGPPVAVLDLAVDREVAFVAVRLNDAAPDGSVRRVSYGLLNLTHRHGHERPSPLVPGRRYRVSVRLNDTAYRFLPGHRLRLAVSTAYWPIAWPPPQRVTLSLDPGRSHLDLPVRAGSPGDALLPPFLGPEAAPPAALTFLHPVGAVTVTERDEETGETTVSVAYDVHGPEGVSLARVEAIDLEVGHAMTERFTIRVDDPLSAQAEIVHRAHSRRGSWSTRVESRTRLTASRKSFRLEAELEAFEGEVHVFSRRWERDIPRDLL